MNSAVEMQQILEDEFKDDEIRKEIAINGLEAYLYTDSILNMHPERLYSTVEAGKILGRNDSTIRNYFRTELVNYIEPEKSGKYYKLNYRSIFRLHMIFLLVEKANKSVADLEYICGFAALEQVVAPNRKKQKGSASELATTEDIELNKTLSILKQEFVLQKMQTKILEETDKLRIYQMVLSKIDREIDGFRKDIELKKIKLENEKMEEKYLRVLDYSLKKSLTKQNKWSFKNIFKGPEALEEKDVDEVLNAAKNLPPKEVISDYSNEIDDLKSKLARKERIRKRLTKKIGIQKKLITNQKMEMQKFLEGTQQFAYETKRIEADFDADIDIE